MSIILSNFGKIKNAEINIDGLTVIAGHNDTGKSTIGKALYSIIKSQVDFPDFYTKIHNKKIISKLINPVFNFINKFAADTNDKAYQDILNKLSEVRFRLFFADKDFSTEDDEKQIKIIFELVKQCQTSFNLSQELCSPILEVENEYLREAEDEEKFKTITDYYFNNTFCNNINNSVTKEEAHILYKFKNTILSELSIKDNDIIKAKIDKEKRFISFSDVTLIDSPMYLEKEHNSDVNYTKDLKQKIEKSQKKLQDSSETNITMKIKSILNNANFSYNDRLNDIEYKVSDEANTLSIANIASGSKSFGILYVLLLSNTIGTDNIIVLDEPENHLHPEWQIKYAEIITLLVKEGYHFLLTSHSPTFIHALSSFAKKNKLDENIVNFYLAEKIKDENYSNITSANDDIDKIFNNLYSPNDILYML